VDPDVRETIERLDVVGSVWIKRHGDVLHVPHVDTARSDDFESITVQQAAAQLSVSDTAVKARLRRGTLRGVKDGRTWRVDATAVRAETACR
jgi:excisionase family DNA binding protein